MLSPHGSCWKRDPLARCRWCRAPRSRGTGGPSGTPPQQSDVSQVLKNQTSPPQKRDVCQGFKNSNLTSTTDVCRVQVQITPVSILAVCPGLRGCTSYTRTSPTTDSSPTEIPFQFFTFESYIYFHFLLEVFALMKISIRGRARKYETLPETTKTSWDVDS